MEKYILLILFLFSCSSSRTQQENQLINHANCLTNGLYTSHPEFCDKMYSLKHDKNRPWALYRKTNTELFLIAVFISPNGAEMLHPQEACESFSSKDKTLICFEK